MMWSLGLIIICTALFWKIDAIILSKIVSNEEVGNYGAAYKVFKFLLLSVRSFFVAFFPMISSLYVDRRREFQKACRKAIRYLVILVIPLSLAVTFFSTQMMTLMWGNKFDGSIIVLQVMIWSLLPFVITEVFSTAFIASNNQNINLILNVISLIVKLILTYFLALKYGAVGAAWATIFSILVLMFTQIPFIIPKVITFNTKKLILPFVKLIAASAVMIFAIYVMKQYYFAIGLIMSAVIYFISLVVFKIFTDEDKRYFTRIIRKRA